MDCGRMLYPRLPLGFARGTNERTGTNTCQRAEHMKWYYSEQLKLYISMEPLKVSPHIIRIAKDLDIRLDWDDYGNLMMLDFAEFKAIVKALGGVILSPAEYWQVYGEAVQSNNAELLKSLSSDCFTEVLDRVYVDEHTYIDHAEVIGRYEYSGERITYQNVVGRPGWITFEDIDLETGHPGQVHEKLSDKKQMKYWSPDLVNTEVKKAIALRGYVTSVAMMSLDLGIPADTRQPKMMVRFCTPNKPEGFLTDEEQFEILRMLECEKVAELADFMKTATFTKLEDSEENEACRIREKIYHRVGAWRIQSDVWGKDALTYEKLAAYVRHNKEMLEAALAKKQMLVFVMGHRNPDSDTVVSSVFEAYRLYLGNRKEDVVYLPLIQARQMPREIRYLLGDALSDSLLYAEHLDVDAWVKQGNVKFVYTDQNYQREYQKYVNLITDHHQLSKQLRQSEIQIPCHIEQVGSCTSLVARKLVGQGYDFDESLSKMLYAAMLMDTENRVPHKMTEWDALVMDVFRRKAHVVSDDELYRKLMLELICEVDGERLYRRDYKHFFGFGFAVLKVSGMMHKPDYDGWLEKVLQLAKQDNALHNDYLTIVKVTDYKEGGLTVDRERLYCVWNEMADATFRSKLEELLQKIIALCLPQARIQLEPQYMEVSQTGKQISRKRIVPAVESLLRYLGQYVFVESIGKWVARDFMKLTDAALAYKEQLSGDVEGRICNISFLEAKKLTAHLGLEMLSLDEYWKVYTEAKRMHDTNLQESLVCSDFLEFLDTCSVEGSVIYHPQVESDKLTGKREYPELLPALPGLISPERIDEATGLPECIFSAANYEDKSLWRYWSPPGDKCYIFSRSYIFLLSQPCLDAKATPEESFVNMGIRPVRAKQPIVEVEIIAENGRLLLKGKSEFDREFKVIYADTF